MPGLAGGSARRVNGVFTCSCTPRSQPLLRFCLQQSDSTAGSWLREHPGAALLLSAMAAGLAVTAVVQPVDVVTTRLWNQPGGPAWDAHRAHTVDARPWLARLLHSAVWRPCACGPLFRGSHLEPTYLLLPGMGVKPRMICRALNHTPPFGFLSLQLSTALAPSTVVPGTVR